ncbi:MAG: hypothetical protein JNM00_07060, partial [Flavobacteriales bacterium]|nr:hypothetical protein [Flavobacteriales bacterium]
MKKFLRNSIAVLVTGLLVSSWHLPRIPYSGNVGHMVPVDTTHAFIRYEANGLQFYGDRNTWHRKMEKLAQLVTRGEGQFHIVHMGGSHVQAGMLTDRLRRNFSGITYSGAGERGLVFPYKLAGTNSPGSVKVVYTGNWTGKRNAVATDSCQWGMTGIAAITTDSIASFKLWTFDHDSINNLFDHVTIFSPFDSTSMQLIVEGATELPGQHGDTWKTFSFDLPQDTLRVRVMRTDSTQSQFNLQGIYFGIDKPGISYHAIGVNGASTASYLKCRDLEQQFAVLHPDVAIFAIGVNDANTSPSDFNVGAFEARYDSLIWRIKAHNPDVALMFITNNDTWYGKSANANGAVVRDAMIRLAEKHNAAVFDLYAIMGGKGSIRQWYQAGLAQKDKIHLTRTGYELQADLMYNAFVG